MSEPFALKDCALIGIGTGEKAQNLRELKDRLLTVHSGCIFHHFWGGLLRPRFEEPEYQNDFAAWAWHGLRDPSLAERLSLIDASDYDDIEELRRELVEVIEERLEQSELVPWAKASDQFIFSRSQVVVFDTGLRFEHPAQLAEFLPRLSVGSVFYHFIDGRRRPPKRMDDFSAWLLGFEGRFDPVIEGLVSIDPYFSSLRELRREIHTVFQNLMPKEEM